jgi:hypothetical protein
MKTAATTRQTSTVQGLPRKRQRWFRAWLHDGSETRVKGLNPLDALDRLPVEDRMQVREVVELV